MDINHQKYPCDMTDDQYELISDLIPSPKSGGLLVSIFELLSMLSFMFCVLAAHGDGYPQKELFTIIFVAGD